MNANQLLLDLLSKTLPSDGSGSSFDDVNSFVIFRNVSNAKEGYPVDYDGFLTALQKLKVLYTDGQARLAYGILLSMAEEGGDGDDDIITFHHWRTFVQWGSKRILKKTNLNNINLASTRIEKINRTKNKLINAMERRQAGKKSTAAAAAIAAERNKISRNVLQLTGRSTSRIRPSSAAVLRSSRRSSRRSLVPTPKPIKKSASHQMFEEKMTTKYGTLRAAFRAIDTDNDHTVDWREVQRLLRNFNMNSEDESLHQLFLEADDDGDGAIDYQEFQKYFGELIQPSTTGGHGLTIQDRSGTQDKRGSLTNSLHAGIENKNKCRSRRDRGSNSGKINGLHNRRNVAAQHSLNSIDSLKVLHEKLVSKYKSLHNAFRWMDEDNDHRVSWEEMQRLLVTFNLDKNDPTIHSLFKTADEDDNGSIDYQEFKNTFGELLLPSTHSSGNIGHHKQQLQRESFNKRILKRSSSQSSQSSSLQLNKSTSKLQKATNKSNTSHDIFHSKMITKFGTIRKAFRWMDEDSDHRITWEEIQRLLRTFNMDSNDQYLKQLFLSADEDSSNHIDYQEFNRYFGEYMQPSTQGGGRSKIALDTVKSIPVPKLSLEQINSKQRTIKSSRRSSTRSSSRNTNIEVKKKLLNPVKPSINKRSFFVKKLPSSSSSKKLIVKGPPSIYKTLQEKMFNAVSSNNDWKTLYKAFRSSDSLRSCSLDQMTFSYHLMEFGVTLTNEELIFLATTMGNVVGPTKQYGMSLTRAQSASIQRGKRRPSISLTGSFNADRSWGSTLRKSGRPQTASLRRSVKSLSARQINYNTFMKQFVLSFISCNNTLSRNTINHSLLD